MFHFQWHITERCNLNCTHCYKEQKFIKEELSTQELLDILDHYYKQLNDWGLDRDQNRISFTGGEPFIRDDFWQILENCFQNKDKITYGILSNGTLLSKESVQKLKALEIDYFQVSLEGLEEINDEIRGQGSFKKIINALELLNNFNIDFSISMTVTKANLREVPDVISLAKEIGASSIGVRRLVPVGVGKKMEELMLTPQETKDLFKYINQENNKSDFSVSVGCEEGLLAQEMILPRGICNAGYYSFSVLPNGDVYPCRRLPILCGNLTQNSFQDILTKSKELQDLRNLNNINQECQSCPYFNECLGGAKCIAGGYFGDPFAPDPQCWRLFDKLPDPEKKWKSNKKEYRGIKYL
ncbi:MAG: radical SAM protein [Candidatus Pacebacteria bacterium]|nr:radical SAM protein [Candidatus Paceibacterota bacterium]